SLGYQHWLKKSNFMVLQRITCLIFLFQPGTVAWIPLAYNELYVALDSLCTTLFLPDYATVMIRQLERRFSDIVTQEGRAYAEGLRGYGRSSNHGNALELVLWAQ
ncbi:MAG: hypothetical protein ACKPKO_07740, partial [Candidatus Fonsibacter sp.]